MKIDTTHAVAALSKIHPEPIETDCSLSTYVTLRTNTVATMCTKLTKAAQWSGLLHYCYEQSIPVLVLGGGSNIALASDRFDGLVILNRANTVVIADEKDGYVDVTVESGAIISRFIMEMNRHGLGNLEYHFGLPGTVGGAVAMNSKWTKPEDAVGDSVVAATVVAPDGQTSVVNADYFQFSYGYSIVQQTKEIVADVTFRMRRDDPEKLKERSREAQAYRSTTQPKGKPTSGCFFKNISAADQESHNLPTRSAGYLIDQAGLKGRRKGAYVVSDLHANFILGEADGSADDLNALVAEIKQTVHDKFGILLREEVHVV